MRTLLILALAASLVAACSGEALPSAELETAPPIALLTQPPPGPGPRTCMTALASGQLSLNRDGLLGISGRRGEFAAVVWPFGFSTVLLEGRVTLLDSRHRPLARLGDWVEIGGGFGANDNTFSTCGDVTVVAPPR